MPKKILIADDIAVNREMLKAALEQDYEILEAQDGVETLDVLTENAGDVAAVLLDIIMPRADGYQVMEQMRSSKELSAIPVIIETAATDADAEMRALSLGAVDFIRKPFNAAVIRKRVDNIIKLREAAAEASAATRDDLTGLYSRKGFFELAERMIAEQEPGYYVMACLDIDNFKVINDQYGTKKGDEVLRAIAAVLKEGFEPHGGICCRVMADNFAVLYPVSFINSEEIERIRKNAGRAQGVRAPITFSIGRYVVDDLSLSASAMFDRATLAETSIKGRYGVCVAHYDETMRDRLIQNQQLTSEMGEALAERQFEVWFQPQYNHSTGALIGSEALVRWRHPEKGLVPPGDFVPAFEANGFVYELDKYVWAESCRYLRKWLDEGRKPLPVSVNISRYDVFMPDLIAEITGLVEKSAIPTELLRLEITESAFAKSAEQIIAVVKQFIALGFTVEIDDFGSGYSSLNTLKDVPAQVIKLDMRFLEDNDHSGRGGNILESIVRMARWLDMSVIAEGVETVEQADYLQSIGCSYVQGYLYARPMPAEEYETLCHGIGKEERLFAMEAVENLNNNTFWDPNSMETLIFNSFVGGACIFEDRNGEVEILRANEKYAQVLGGEKPLPFDEALKLPWKKHLSAEDCKSIHDALLRSQETGDEVSGEYVFYDLPGCVPETYLRTTMRVIATAGDRFLVYCTNENMTAQRVAEKKEREAEQKRLEAAGRFQAIMENLDSAVTAVSILDGNVNYLFSNNRFYEMLGYSEAEYLAAFGHDFGPISPVDRPWVLEKVEETLRTGEHMLLEYRDVRLDGKEIWVRQRIVTTELAGIEGKVTLSIMDDVSEEKQAELRERRSSEQAQAIMDDAGSGITASIVQGADIHFLFSNDKYYEILGFTREQYEAEVPDAYQLIDPEDRERVLASSMEAYRSQKTIAIEYRVHRRDGALRWVRAILSATHFTGVEATVQLSVFTDITTEKQVVQSLREKDDQLSFLNEAAHALLAQPDAERGIRDTLQKLLQYFAGDRAYVFEIDSVGAVANNTYEACAEGVTEERERLQGVPLSYMHFWLSAFERESYIAIADVGALDETRAEERDTLAAQGIRSLVAVPLYRDGALIGFIGIDNPGQQQSHVASLAAVGDYLAVMLTRRDLNAKIMSDTETLTSLMDDTPGGFVRMRVHPDGSVVPVYFNKGFYQLVAMDHDALMEIYGNDAFAGVHPDDVEIVSDAVRRMLENGEANSSRYRLRYGKGGYIWLRIFGRSIREPNGERYLNIYYTDATEQERAEEQQKELLDNLPCGAALYEYDGDGIRPLHINKRCRELFGCTKEAYEAACSIDPYCGVAAEDLPGLKRQLETMAADGTPVDATCRIHPKDGAVKWINLRAEVAGRHDGKVVFNVALFDVTAQQNALEHLRISEEENRLAIRHSGSMICRYSVADRVATLLPEVAAAFHLPEKILDVPYGPVKNGLIAPESAKTYIGLYEGILAGQKHGSAIYREKNGDGWRWMQAQYSTIFSDAGTPLSAVISYTDVTEQIEKDAVYKRWQQSIRDKREDAYSLFRCNVSKKTSFGSREGSLLRMHFASGTFNFDERTEKYLEEFVFSEDRERFSAFLKSDALLAGYYRGKRSDTIEYREILPEGGLRWLRLSVDLVEYPNSADVEAYLLFEDIDEKKRAELRTQALAETDPLTDVLNRTAFTSRVDHFLKNAKASAQHALLMLDIDGFKMVNDAFGHSAGDRELINIADSLRSVLRKDDLLGRLGGDEFVMFLGNIPNETVAANKAKRICALTCKSFSLEVQVSGSVGIVVSPRDGMDFESLYRKADSALYYVKGSGKNNYAFYRAEMSDEHLLLEKDGTGEDARRRKEKKRRMLIVDDNKTDYAMLANLFQDDFMIDKARDGNSALVRLRHYGSAISVVLLDLLMPGMDGFAVLEKMQNSAEMRAIPVVVVSAVEDREIGLRAIRSGASDFVNKPVDPDLLRIRVQSAVSKAENERLRAKNSVLEFENGEVIRYKTILERTGVVVIEHDWMTGAFTYDPSISEHLLGIYDNRKLWHILLADLVADTATVQKMQELTHAVASNRERMDAQMLVQLKTPSRELHWFRMSVFKLINELGLTSKLLLTLFDVGVGAS